MFLAEKRRMVEMTQGSNNPAWKASLVISNRTFVFSPARLIRANCSGGLGPPLYNW